VTSDGRPYLCHWGVLVSDLTIIDTKVILQTANKGNRTVHLGKMYELLQIEGRSHVFVDTEFTMRELNGWRSFAEQYFGETRLTHEQITTQGINPTVPCFRG